MDFYDLIGISTRLELGTSTSNSSFLSLSLDIEWNESQFATESRLRTEEASVEEIHFTPDTPLFVKGKLTYMF